MQCPKCGMGYIPGLPEDEAAHFEYCDLIVNGPAVVAIGDEYFFWRKDEDRILLVTNTSPEEHRKLAHNLSTCANREMRYDGGIYRYYDPPDDREVHLFLYVRASRAIGLLLFEKRTIVWRCTWQGDETPTCVAEPERSPMWSMGFVWVHKQHRQLGIAYQLFHEAKCALHLDEDAVGWYTPFSKDGKAFVRRLYPIHFFVAK